MALTPNNLFDTVRDIIQDTGKVRWSDNELLRYLNDGRRDIAVVRPDLYSETTNLTLVAGTRQSVPTDGTRLMDVVRNVTAADVVGRAVRIVEREVLDAQSPDWHTEPASTVIKHFMYDEREPKTFYVYPPATAGHKLTIVYSKAPTEITSGDLNSTSVLAREDIFVGALTDYLAYRCFSKDAEFAGNSQRAVMHYQAFANIIGIGNKKRFTNSPNLNNIGGAVPRAATVEAGG
jgi:hypothetical protein